MNIINIKDLEINKYYLIYNNYNPYIGVVTNLTERGYTEIYGLDLEINKYYFIYNNYNPYIGVVTNLTERGYTEIYGICNYKTHSTDIIITGYILNRVLNLANNDMIFELTDSEILKHIVMETI